MADEIEEGGDPVSPLPSQRDDEFRPFVRRLPEWQFWSVRQFFRWQIPLTYFPLLHCDPFHQALVDSRYSHRLILYIFGGV